MSRDRVSTPDQAYPPLPNRGASWTTLIRTRAEVSHPNEVWGVFLIGTLLNQT